VTADAASREIVGWARTEVILKQNLLAERQSRSDVAHITQLNTIQIGD
jgi:hypothetical protein